MGPRKVDISTGSSRVSGELGEYAVEGEQVFESPENASRQPIQCRPEH
jgi:hypothetical protein